MIANASTYKFFETMGADVSRWVWTSPGEYSGSVFSSLAADIAGAPAVGSTYGKEARQGLIEAPLDFVPMWGQMKNMAKAMNDPNPLIRMLGFTPVKPKPPFSDEYAVNPEKNALRKKMDDFLTGKIDLTDEELQELSGAYEALGGDTIQDVYGGVHPTGREKNEAERLLDLVQESKQSQDPAFEAMRQKYLARPAKEGTTEQTEVLPGVFRIGDMSWANMPDHKSYDLIVWDKATGQYVDTFFSTAADEDLVEKVQERRQAFGWDERPK